MSRAPLDPKDIPDDTTTPQAFGWMAESLARSYALRLAGILALLGALIAAMQPQLGAGPRIATMVIGVLFAGVLLLSQLRSWSRTYQWLLVLAVALVSGAMLAIVMRLS